jgi:hypothetical protein
MPDNTLPATQGFGGVSLANMDLARFRQSLETAEQNLSINPGMQYLRMNRSGEWSYGQDNTEVQQGSEWAVNPMSLEAGFVAWGTGGGKPLGKNLRTILGPPVLMSELPAVGAEWSELVAFKLRCLNGDDAGMEAAFETNSFGGRSAFAELVRLLKAQIDLDASRLIPIIRLESDSYRNQYGLIFNPIFAVARWCAESELPVLQTVAPPPAMAAPTVAPPVNVISPPAAATLPPSPMAAAVPAAPAPRGRGRPPLAPVPVPSPVPPLAAAAEPAAGRRRRAAV